MTGHRSCCSSMEVTQPRYQNWHGTVARNGSLLAWLKITCCRSGRWQKVSTAMTIMHRTMTVRPHKRNCLLFCSTFAEEWDVLLYL
jgi:hypothetical protein